MGIGEFDRFMGEMRANDSHLSPRAPCGCFISLCLTDDRFRRAANLFMCLKRHQTTRKRQRPMIQQGNYKTESCKLKIETDWWCQLYYVGITSRLCRHLKAFP